MQKEVPVMSTLRNQIIQSLEGLSDDSLLQFLDVISQGEKYSELSDPETGIFLKNYAKQQNYSKELLFSVLSGITGPTAKKLIKWGIIYEFIS